jgi:phage tail-like protein
VIPGRPASLVATFDQWLRAAHAATTVDAAVAGGPPTAAGGAALTLTWDEPVVEPASADGVCPARGLASDRLCRVYRVRERAVDRLAVGPTAAGLDYASMPEPVTVIGAAASVDPNPPGPDFAGAPPSLPLDAVGIAIDGDDRLFLADAGARSISVLDLWSRRLLRSIPTGGAHCPARRPGGLAARGQVVYAVLRDPAGLLRLTASRGPDEVPLPATIDDLPAGSAPSRVAVLLDGTPVLLVLDTDGAGWLLAGNRAPRSVGAASEIVVDRDGTVVLAPCPSAGGAARLRRFVPTPTGWTRSFPLDAAGYDGGGLVVTDDGRIGYFTAAGFRLAVLGAVTYRSEGHCVTYRLDSGVPLNRWGRVFLDACIPAGTACEVGATTSDDPATTAPVPAPAPAGVVTRPVHRRPEPSTPWWRPPASGYADGETFEAPIDAPAGRYLWVTLRLTGNGRRSPRVREIRIERQAHTLLRRLPKVYSGDARQEAFLHRYLAVFDGLLHDLDLRSRLRDLLVDPHGTPIEALDWLASFVGLLLDDRWPPGARRQLVAEIVPLYRLRGTAWALSRYIEIFLAGEHATERDRPWVTPVIVEHFRLRGLGGPLLGADPTVTSRSVLGAGFRVGGAVGELGTQPLDPAEPATSPFERHAHRFSVLVPRPLGAEEEAAIRHILDTERPAHTTYDLCTVDAGMRVGDGLHLGLSTIVGPTGALDAAITDLALIGRGAVLGGPTTGVAVEAGRVGTTTRIG